MPPFNLWSTICDEVMRITLLVLAQRFTVGSFMVSRERSVNTYPNKISRNVALMGLEPTMFRLQVGGVTNSASDPVS